MRGYGAAMRPGDALDERETQAGATGLGGKAWFEGAATGVVGQARPAIGDFDFVQSVTLIRGEDKRAAGGHCFDRVDDEVRQGATQEFTIGQHLFVVRHVERD